MVHKIRYLPTLFDRLLDDEPKSQREVPEKFYYDSRQMRAIVQRDLVALLNTTSIEHQIDECRHREVASSVLNYGVSAMTGGLSNAHSWAKIEAAVRNAILRFEPRIVAESLLIRPLLDKSQPARYGVIPFEIRALIWWEPRPIDLCLHATYDSETASMGLTSP